MEARKALAAEHIGIELNRRIGGKMLVGEVNQNHQATEGGKVKVGQIHITFHSPNVTLGLHLLVYQMLGQTGQER